MLNYLSQTRTIWITFILTLVLTATFGGVMKIWQFGIIDEMYTKDVILNHIRNMTSEQRTVHAWMTGTLDVVYPFAYGAFFIGVTVKFFKQFGLWLALPAMLVIPVDLVEGYSQIMLLTGHEDFVTLKQIVTPIKLVLYFSAMGIAAIGLMKGWRHGRRG